MPSLGKMEEFDPASTNINRYLERLEQCFIANGVSADTGERFKRRATLISVIGSKAYDVLSDLCTPSFGENLQRSCNHSQRPFCYEETSYRGKIPISQLHLTRRRKRFHLRRQAQTPRFYLQLRHTSK